MPTFNLTKGINLYTPERYFTYEIITNNNEEEIKITGFEENFHLPSIYIPPTLAGRPVTQIKPGALGQIGQAKTIKKDFPVIITENYLGSFGTRNYSIFGLTATTSNFQVEELLGEWNDSIDLEGTGARVEMGRFGGLLSLKKVESKQMWSLEKGDFHKTPKLEEIKNFNIESHNFIPLRSFKDSGFFNGKSITINASFLGQESLMNILPTAINFTSLSIVQNEALSGLENTIEITFTNDLDNFGSHFLRNSNIKSLDLGDAFITGNFHWFLGNNENIKTIKLANGINDIVSFGSLIGLTNLEKIYIKGFTNFGTQTSNRPLSNLQSSKIRDGGENGIYTPYPVAKQQMDYLHPYFNSSFLDAIKIIEREQAEAKPFFFNHYDLTENSLEFSLSRTFKNVKDKNYEIILKTYQNETLINTHTVNKPDYIYGETFLHNLVGLGSGEAYKLTAQAFNYGSGTYDTDEMELITFTTYSTPYTEWNSNETYNIDDIVKYNDNYYISLHNTNNEIPTDEIYWSPIEYTPNFELDKNYSIGDVVIYDGVFYEANQNITNSTEYPNESLKWDLYN